MVEYENSAVGVAEPKDSQLTVARESPDENVWGVELEPEETASHTHPASSKKKKHAQDCKSLARDVSCIHIYMRVPKKTCIVMHSAYIYIYIYIYTIIYTCLYIHTCLYIYI